MVEHAPSEPEDCIRFLDRSCQRTETRYLQPQQRRARY